MTTATVGQAWVELVPRATNFGRRLQSEVGNDVSRLGTTTGDSFGREFDKSSRSRMSRFGSTLKGLVGPAVGIAAAAGIGVFLKGAFDEAQEAAVIGSRTENVISKMGNAANISAAGVADLAEALSNKVGVDDEAIQSGQNMLLTFANLRNEAGAGNDIFNRTSSLMVDLSVAMGKDMQSSATMLGKALNDPIKGISALTRVGVQFTEQQQAQITALTESGDLLGAQKIILGEVEKQFGGAGAAMATPAQKAKVAFDNLKEQLGTALLPTLNRVMTFVSTTVIPGISRFVETIQRVAGPLRSGAQSSSALGRALRLVGEYAREMRGMVAENIGPIKSIIRDAARLIAAVWKRYGDIWVSTIRGVMRGIRDVVGGVIRVIRGIVRLVLGLLTGDWRKAWSGLKDIVGGVWRIIRGLVRIGVSLVLGTLRTAWRTMAAAARGAFNGLKDIAAAGLGKVVDAVKSIPGRIRQLGGLFKSAGSAVIRAMIDGLKNAPGFVSDIAGNVWDAVRGMLNAAIDKINSALEFTIDLPGPKNLTVNIADIPQLAGGTGYHRGGLAVVGEQGPELVNLPRGSQVTPNHRLGGLVSRLGGGSGRQPVYLVLEDGRQLAGYLDERIGTHADLADEKGRAA